MAELTMEKLASLKGSKNGKCHRGTKPFVKYLLEVSLMSQKSRKD